LGELCAPADGSNWKKLVDKPHIELDRKVYPAPGEEPCGVREVRSGRRGERHPLACIKYNKAITQFSKDSGEGGVILLRNSPVGIESFRAVSRLIFDF
jgi:hypothetical protein